MTTSDSFNRLARFVGLHLPVGELRAAGSRVLRQTAGESPVMVVVLGVVTLVGIGTTVLFPAVLAAAIDAASSGRDLPGAMVQLAVVLAVATATDALGGLLKSYYGIQVTARLRHRLLRRVLALGVPSQQRFPAGDLLSRLAGNAAVPANFIPLLLSAGSVLLIAAGSVVGLVLIDLRLAGAFLLGVPVAIMAGRAFLAKAGEPFLRYQQLQAAVIARLLDAHRGIRTIRASGTVNQEIRRILEPLPELHDAGWQTWAAQRLVSWQLSLLAPMLQVLVLAVGGFVLTAGGITPGQLVAAASYVGLALGSIGLFEVLVALLSCQIGAGRVGEVLETELAVPPPLTPVAIPPGRGQLELRDVSVRMGERMVLDHLDLSVPAGTSVAVVGRSGTGKSTLVSLVGRLLDPDQGEVLLDGVPVSQVDLGQLRQAVTYAFERPALLGSCVHDMIAYARPTASRAEVEAAARAAQADRFIRLLPEGYDTPLAQAPMSGGELQRLGLARAVLTRARVIVLDDATSSLDTATEVKVAEALERVLAGRTSLVVAHRAATAARANLVAWLDAGRIRALAPHAALWAHPSYRAVFAADSNTSTSNGSGPPAILQAPAQS
jgi:ATP-binding cassette subfamily B protein